MGLSVSLVLGAGMKLPSAFLQSLSNDHPQTTEMSISSSIKSHCLEEDLYLTHRIILEIIPSLGLPVSLAFGACMTLPGQGWTVHQP